MKNILSICTLFGDYKHRNSYGNIMLSEKSPILHSKNFSDGFVQMCIALGDSHTAAAMKLHLWIHGFYPEYKFCNRKPGPGRTKKMFVNKQQLARIIEKHPDWSIDTLATHYNVSSYTIKARIKEYNIPYQRKC